MTPGQLDITIRRTILTRGVRAVQVIARRTALPPRSAAQTAIAGLAVGLVMAQTLTPTERASWIAWSWGLCFLSLRRARKQRNNSDLGRMRQKLRSRPRRIEAAAAVRAAS